MRLVPTAAAGKMTTTAVVCIWVPVLVAAEISVVMDIPMRMNLESCGRVQRALVRRNISMVLRIRMNASNSKSLL